MYSMEDFMKWQKDHLKEAQEKIDYHRRELEFWELKKAQYLLSIEAAVNSVQADGEEPVRLNFTLTDDDVKRTEELFPHLQPLTQAVGRLL
jgi:hypothetical protein